MNRSLLVATRARQRGAGALVAVVLLYVAMAIIVVFANRSLIFEQKTSANQYRATMALEAAEAGIEWATTMLNKSGLINATCNDLASGSGFSFRDKYLDYVNGSQTWNLNAASGTVVAACVTSQAGTDWTCSCPTAGTAPSVTAPAGGGFKPGFAVAFVTNAATRAVDLVSYGCTSAITNATCAGDAAATVRVTLASVVALATTPGAPLTARGSVSIGNAALGVQNGDPGSAGITVNAGMGVDASNLRITSTPGTPPWATVVGNDPSLRNSTEDQMFQTFFGMPKATWRDSVADAILTCPCTESTIATALAGNKRKLWLQGNLVMNANQTLGSVDDPFMMIVDGTIEMRGDLEVYAVIYATGITWDNTGGGSALLVGAAISEGNYTGNGSPDYYYDPRVMNNLIAIPGRFVRVPGTWRDFP
jgi:Tfp pilus assembly protein PilX